MNASFSKEACSSKKQSQFVAFNKLGLLGYVRLNIVYFSCQKQHNKTSLFRIVSFFHIQIL